MSTFNANDVAKTAKLAKLQFSETEQQQLGEQLKSILDFAERIEQCDTHNVAPLAHPFETTQVLRDDKVSETDQRSRMQVLAPCTEAGLYLVPQVIE